MQDLIVEIIKLIVMITSPFLLIFLLFRKEIKNIKAYTKDFKCSRCGHCCQFAVLLNKKDIQNIISKGYAPDSFLEKKNLLNLLKKNKTGFCIFLNSDNSCSIYEVRPQACRKFPYLKYPFFKGCDTRCKFISS